MDYTIKYRKGKDNLVADALSRRDEKGSCKAITVVTPEWIKEVVSSYVNTAWLQELLPQLVIHPHNQKGYTVANGVVRYKGKIVIGNAE